MTCRDADRENTPWLEQYRSLLVPGLRVLDLGCGAGDDSIELAEYGCTVVALDLDSERVRLVPGDAARLRVAADICGGLPFRDQSFDCVVASLSLHYFSSSHTRHAIEDIARILRARGWLICRVNAIGDVNFGYGAGTEIEPSLFRQPEGHLKRFFDEPMLRRFIEPCFRLERTESRMILQRGIEKRTLECLARKPES